MTGRRALAAAVFLALTCSFGGRYGLVAGAAIFGAWHLLRLPRRVLWAASVLLLVAAPFALMAQGLPRTPVVGPGFGTDHLVAHVLVGLALATAGLAGLLELVEGRPEGRRAGRRGLREPRGGSPPGGPAARWPRLG